MRDNFLYLKFQVSFGQLGTTYQYLYDTKGEIFFVTKLEKISLFQGKSL